MSNINPLAYKSFYFYDSFDYCPNYQMQNPVYQLRLDLLLFHYSAYLIKNNYDEMLKKYNTIYIKKIVIQLLIPKIIL